MSATVARKFRACGSSGIRNDFGVNGNVKAMQLFVKKDGAGATQVLYLKFQSGEKEQLRACEKSCEDMGWLGRKSRYEWNMVASVDRHIIAALEILLA
ncbi:hypothetical protein [Archangium lipolyticum]|uniref:hypothetical protein n=1 Tax=Archangium lipolyticum TaxID=2970465 RepID=UPI00214A481A|nr:hypothetical protein [Archangium lipolyticum]